MSQQVTIQQIRRLDDWSNEHGTFHAYLLKCAGAEKPVEISQKPSSPPPKEGDVLLLDLRAHPTNEAWLKGKRVQAQQSRNGDRQDDPATRASIEKQVALKAAVEFHKGDGKPPQDVVVTAGMFQQWLGAS